MDKEFKLDDEFTGYEIRPAKLEPNYVTIDCPEDQQLLAKMGDKSFKISKRYFAYSIDGVPYETDNVDLPFDEWDKCKEHTP